MDKLFCVGDEKTGTHSVAGLFRGYRAEHEPEAHDLRPLVEARLRGDAVDDSIDAYVAGKEARLHLEVDSSFLNGEIIDLLVRRYPEARYVLTLREPRSWLDSKVNQMVTYKSPRWIALRALRHGPPEGHPPEEQALAERGLPTLDGFFGEYARFNAGVVEQVPANRLLVLRTPDIRERADRLATFAGVPLGTLDLDRSHEFQGPVKHHVLDELDPSYLDAKLHQHCDALVLPLYEAAATS